jgi:hypothetical protein
MSERGGLDPVVNVRSPDRTIFTIAVPVGTGRWADDGPSQIIVLRTMDRGSIEVSHSSGVRIGHRSGAWQVLYIISIGLPPTAEPVPLVDH